LPRRWLVVALPCRPALRCRAMRPRCVVPPLQPALCRYATALASRHRRSIPRHRAAVPRTDKSTQPLHPAPSHQLELLAQRRARTNPSSRAAARCRLLAPLQSWSLGVACAWHRAPSSPPWLREGERGTKQRQGGEIIQEYQHSTQGTT
jgi:hypothetical protein